MNKAQLAKCLANELSISATESLRYLNILQKVIGDELQQDHEVKLVGFGTFVPWHQTARMGRNPRTGKECIIESRTSVKFKAGKDLLDKMNLPK